MNSSGTLPAFVQFAPNNQPTVAQFVSDFLASVPLSRDYSLKLLSSVTDPLGERHDRFALLYRNIPVLGGEYIVHARNGMVRAANGNLISDLNLDAQPTLTEAQALDVALRQVGASVYKWQDPFWVADLKESTGDPAATYFPKGELCWSPPVFGAVERPSFYALAYRFDIQAASPDKFVRVIVNAKSGAIVTTLPMESNCTGTTVNSIFNGSQGISTDKFTGTNFRLRDDCQTANIRVRDWNSTTLTSSPIEIQNNTNTWTAMTERLGGTVLWETKQAYLYYLNTFGRASYNNSNGNVEVLVNTVFDCSPPAGCTYTDNASMSFSGGNMKVGLGSSGTLANSWSALDIISHEYTHAVTGSSAALTYANESGALNESFSDILGEAVENYVTGSADWLEGANRTSGAIRSLSNPNAFTDPDTYLGTNWFTGTADNGGVHTNSGVQNFWYYLVAVGGSGTNDNGWAYSFSGIGINKAAAIAYRNLTVYLTSGSTYNNARTGSIAAAGDLYGAGSTEQNTVIKAWRAVGIDPCVITCPSNVVASNTGGQCGALASYSPPATNGLCFTVSASPPSGSFFAVGTTAVTATSTSGASCTFNVTINDTENPAVSCPAAVSVECTTHSGTPASDLGIQAFLNGFTATDNCPPPPTKSNNAPGTFPHGPTTVIFGALDSHGNTNSCSATLTVIDTKPPVLTCPVDLTLECDSHCDASLGGVPATDATVAAWLASFSTLDACDPSPTNTLPYPACFPLGNTTVTFTSTDDDGNSASCSRTVHVVDTTPPVITAALDRYSLWPPNHKLATINSAVTVTDICDPNPTFVLTSISSNEPENGLGDGDTAPDVVGADYGTSDLQFLLRSERSGPGSGRKYTIVYTASDLSGNHASQTLCVTVPHDQSGTALASEGFDEDGAGFASDAAEFALVVPSVGPSASGDQDLVGSATGIKPSTTPVDAPVLEAGDIDPARAYVGNSAGALVSSHVNLVDVDGDGLIDAVFHYPVAAVQSLLAASTPEDGPIGLHFQIDATHTYLVNNIFALGAPVALPAMTTASNASRVAGNAGSGTAGSQGNAIARDGAITPAAEGAITPAADGAITPAVVVLPHVTRFAGVYPNPFEGNALLAFDLASEQNVSLAVYDLRGARIRTLQSGLASPGHHQIAWDGRDQSGRAVAGGIYLVRFEAGHVRMTRKAVLMK